MWANHSQRSIALLVLVLAPGCALFAGKAKGPEEVHDLVGSIERVYVDSELARERTASAVTALESIASELDRTTCVVLDGCDHFFGTGTPELGRAFEAWLR